MLLGWGPGCLAPPRFPFQLSFLEARHARVSIKPHTQRKSGIIEAREHSQILWHLNEALEIAGQLLHSVPRLSASEEGDNPVSVVRESLRAERTRRRRS